MVWHEASTIQKAVIDWAKTAGWEHIRGEDLPRDHLDVVVESWVSDALLRLNEDLVDDRASAELIVADILLAISGAADGLIAANEALTVMLRGEHAFADARGQSVPRSLIDFADPRSNRLVVSDEVTIGAAGGQRRFDIVFYVNGFPLVVVETKNPTKQNATWLSAANDIYETYEVEYPNFFAPNVFNVATDGNELRVGAVRAKPNEETWSLWGSTELPATLVGPKRTEEAAKRLLTPEMVLLLLETFTLFRHPTSATAQSYKLVARYPQVEGAYAIHAKVVGGDEHGGLIWHHQGSGKTLLMAFAAFKLLKDPAADSPTVVILVDRKELVRQGSESFRTAGMPSMHLPQTSYDLRKLLKNDARGVIFTTIHKFAEAGFLNNRSNIIVLVDEAHRTQEGVLGDALRAAVPNAKFFGMTGTPISRKDRNTFRLFGDPDDPNMVMSRYEPRRSLIDGTTVPVSVEARLVRFTLDKEELDRAFDDLATEEGLDDDKKEFLAGKVSHTATLLRNPERVREVCADIVAHYLARFRPLDLKAQVVAFDRELVVAYATAIRAELARAGSDLEVGVNIHVSNSKNENPALKPYAMTEAQEEAQKRRFLDLDDKLAFLVVTSKLMTGFDAPIEGVLYLDKPIKAQNLFQTITRPNRTWTNPNTKQVKKFGLVVDYIGLAKAIGDALVDPNEKDGGEEPEIADTEKLAGKFVTDLALLLAHFNGIDMSSSGWESFAEARERIASEEDTQAFIKGFIAMETVWEFLYPHDMLEPFKDQYRWLASLYESMKPSNVARTLLWQKYGTKTYDLIWSNIDNVRVEASHSRSVKLDAAGLELVKQIATKLKLPIGEHGPDTIGFDDVLDTIEARVKRRLEDSDSAVYKSLAERIEKLRKKSITSAEDSLDFLRQALDIATAVVEADRLDSEGELEQSAALFDPNRRALTQIIDENKPDGLHVIVPDVAARIDAIVSEVAFTGWRESTPGDREVTKQLRATLRQFGLPVTGELFNKAYAYVRENY